MPAAIALGLKSVSRGLGGRISEAGISEATISDAAISDAAISELAIFEDAFPRPSSSKAFVQSV
jgi:hypothetical protein